MSTSLANSQTLLQKCQRLKRASLLQFLRLSTSAISNPANDLSDTVSVKLNERDFPVHSIWLRHHCQCPECQNPLTHQRIKIPSHLRYTSKVAAYAVNDSLLRITWDDGHKSKYSLDWLRTNAPSDSIHSGNFHFPKCKETMDEIFKDIGNTPGDPLEASTSFSKFMETGNDGVRLLLKNILQFGYGIVSGCPPDFETTKKVISKVSHVQNTLFGDFSEWTSNLAHADTAYTADEVYLHTDTSYFTEPIGLQIFHCLKHDGNGGINSLADGFQIARKLYQERPELYEVLSTVNVESHYVDPEKHNFRSDGLIFSHDWINSQILRIRYNPHDMAPLSHVPFDKVGEFYEGLMLLSDLLQEAPQHIKLAPGIVIFLDNWRTLHGRTAFTGFRHLCGAYIARSDWLSRARVLGLLTK